MKSTKNEKVTAKDEYPCLKTEGDGLVVLFTEPSYGLVVSPDGCYGMGHVSADWNEHNFTTYHGTITLEN